MAASSPGGPRAILAKPCDRLHNIRTLSACILDKRRSQLEETTEYHLKLLIPALHAHGGIWVEYANQIEQKMLAAMSKVEVS